MYEWSDNQSNALDILILPPDNNGSLVYDEELQDDDVIIDKELLSDVYGKVQVQTNFSNGEDNDDEVEDNDNPKEEQTKLRAQNEREKMCAGTIETC